MDVELMQKDLSPDRKNEVSNMEQKYVAIESIKF